MIIRRKYLRPFLLLVLGIFIIAEILMFTPSEVEESRPLQPALEPEVFIQKPTPTLAPGIPTHRIPEYSIHQFQYVSIQKSEKLWRIESDTANLFNPEKLMHSRQVKAYLYDPNDQVTIVTGREAKYFLNQRDLEIFGDVHTIFPDGFEVHSEYLQYKPDQKHIIIPIQYAVHGKSHETSGQDFYFDSYGLDYVMGESKISLLQSAKVMLKRPQHLTPQASSYETAGVPDLTTIQSDYCLIYRDQKFAQFSMNSHRPPKTRFVYITQPTLLTRSRRADIHYGNFEKVLQYLTAYDDVLVKEISNNSKSLRYATAGRADFDTIHDIIKLSQFPQVYQDQDTVTGDIILMHRETDVIEIENSNAYSEGSEK